jgi:hypothetical protein
MIRTRVIQEDNDGSRNRSHRFENELAIEKTPVHEPRAIDETVAIERLIALGEEQGHVKFDDVMLVFPQVEENLDLLENVYDALLSAGIPYSDNRLVRRKGQGKPPAEEGKPFDAIWQEPERDEAIDANDTIGLYLYQAGRVPLLTRNEEVELAKRINRGRKASRDLAQVSVSAKQRAKLQRLIEDGMAAHKHLILANLRLVFNIAKKYVRRGVSLMDLVQEGHIGLIRATKKFDHRRGFKFSTYATWWVRQAITRAVSDRLKSPAYELKPRSATTTLPYTRAVQAFLHVELSCHRLLRTSSCQFAKKISTINTLFISASQTMAQDV